MPRDSSPAPIAFRQPAVTQAEASTGQCLIFSAAPLDGYSFSTIVMLRMSKPARRRLTAAPAASGRVPQTATIGLPEMPALLALSVILPPR